MQDGGDMEGGVEVVEAAAMAAMGAAMIKATARCGSWPGLANFS